MRRGFVPVRRATFVSAKVAKTMLAVGWPFGFPARFADTGGAQTRCAQTLRAFSPVSAALLGHTTRPGKLVEARNSLLIEQWYLGNSLNCRVSARQPSHFCFGKSSQNHVGRGMALRVPCAVHRLRRRANSLRSNNARLFPGFGCTARPHHQSSEDY